MNKYFLLTIFLFSINGFSQSWNTTGNAGTNPSTNFLGTTDNQSLVLKTNNQEWVRLTPSGRIIFQNNEGGLGWDTNLFLGGGSNLATGKANTSLGIGSLSLITSGGGNTAFGSNSLRNLTTGSSNTGIGSNSLMSLRPASVSNTAVGANSATGLGLGDNNTAIGMAALARYNSTEFDLINNTTAIGQGSLANIINGNNNTSIGRIAMRALINGNNNIGIGQNVASNLVSGNNNIIIGNEITTTSPNISDQLNIGNWIYGQNGKIGIGGLPDNNVGLRVYGRTQIKSDINSDGFAVTNDLGNIDNGASLVFLRYGQYQPNNPGVLDVSGLTSPSLYELFFSLKANGKLFLGTSTNLSCSDCNDYRLFVKNGIRTEKIKVDIASANGWADYVFKKDYKLATLEEVEKHINDKGHLPNIPSAEEVVKNGLNLGEMDARLLEKIEELTLYCIDLNKKNSTLNSQVQQQQQAIDKLLQKVEMLEKVSK